MVLYSIVFNHSYACIFVDFHTSIKKPALVEPMGAKFEFWISRSLCEHGSRKNTLWKVKTLGIGFGKVGRLERWKAPNLRTVRTPGLVPPDLWLLRWLLDCSCCDSEQDSESVGSKTIQPMFRFISVFRGVHTGRTRRTDHHKRSPRMSTF